MSDAVPNPAADQRPRWRVLLLGLIGGAAVVLPLAQLLLFQVDALRQDRAQLAWLDPVAEAVGVQRGLADHEAVAARTLGDRRELEDERRQRQAVVDRHLEALRTALPPRLWPLARREADGLAADWRLLAHAVAEQRIGPADSGQRHRLLQEQAVQVMDLLAASAPTPDATVFTAGATPAALARQAAALDAQRAHWQQRIARQARARDLAALSLAGALGLLVALALTATRRHRAAWPARADTVRRSPGRRAADRAAVASPAEQAAAQLQAVRRRAEDAPLEGPSLPRDTGPAGPAAADRRSETPSPTAPGAG